MFDKLASIEQQYNDLVAQLATSKVQSDPAEYKKLAKATSKNKSTAAKSAETFPSVATTSKRKSGRGRTAWLNTFSAKAAAWRSCADMAGLGSAGCLLGWPM